MGTRKRFSIATETEILRSYQRDNQFTKTLSDNLKEIFYICRKYNIPFTQSEIPANLLYFALTSGVGNQTLGEEYTGIVQANLKKLQVQPLSVRTLVALIECFGEIFVNNLLKRCQKWINSPKSTLTQEAVSYFNHYIPRIQAMIPILILFHNGIFHLTGKKPTLGKRIFNVDYIKVYGRRPTSDTKWGIKFLGIVLLTQCILRFWRLEPQIFEPQESKSSGNEVTRQENSGKCRLCLENVPTTATICGHLFCWACIVEWLQTQKQCPLCREILPPSRIIHLMNLGS